MSANWSYGLTESGIASGEGLTKEAACKAAQNTANEQRRTWSAWEAGEDGELIDFEPQIKATISERGNGLPDVGDYVPGDDGELYRVCQLVGRIQTGSSGSGVSNWRHAYVQRVSWDDCEESDEFPALVQLASD